MAASRLHLLGWLGTTKAECSEEISANPMSTNCVWPMGMLGVWKEGQMNGEGEREGVGVAMGVARTLDEVVRRGGWIVVSKGVTKDWLI